MRFLLLSFLYNVAFADIECNEAAKAGSAAGQICFATPTACTVTDLTKTDATACKNAADNAALEWWDETGTALTADDGKAAHCTYNADPLVSSATKTTADGNWDQTNKANYELKISSVVSVNAAGEAATKLGPDHAKGYAAVMQGEALTSAVYTSLGTILGSDTNVGTPKVVCAKVSRSGMPTITLAQNGFLTIFDSGDGKCIDGVKTTVTDQMDHNAAADANKKCYHLPWTGNYIAAATCGDGTYCDRFVETGTQCVTATKKMSAYTAATATVNHCTIQPGAAQDDKYRHTHADYSSQVCATGSYCNMYGRSAFSDPICIPSTKSIAASAKAAARVAGSAVSSTDTSKKWCIGVTLGADQCETTEVCNPHAATRETLCIDNSTTAANNPKSMAFGAVGAAAPTTGTDTRKYCIGDNAAGAICGAATVCNYAGGDQAGVAGGDVCLPHTKLLGTIADTAPWTAAAQKKLDGVAAKFCLATDGTTFSSKECATTEKCNPHASSTADVCKKGTTVLNHGDIAPEAADVVADSQVVCIGKSFWKNCASANGDVKEVCNEGAAALTDVCILTTDCANPEEPLKAFREAGVEAAEDQKWCFATDGAAKCGLDTLCNPSGVDGGTGSAAICADATKRVPHGEAATEELIHCYGDSGNAALATDESEDGWLCDEGKGKFHDPKTKMEPRSKNETPDPVPEGEKAVEVCFGKDKVETCDVGVYCNSMGTETGCSDAACTSKNICITEESIIAEGEQWVEDGKSVCLNADATAGEDCTTDKMYCDQTEGVCSAEEIASTEEPSSGGSGEETSGCATQSLAAAAVVAILSA